MDIIQDIKNEINYGLDNLDLNKINEIKDIIINNKNNNIFFSGIGKCETIAIHLCNLLKSLSYKTFFLNIQNSSHGDIGCMKENDIIMLFSKSGNTSELINFIKIANMKKIRVISITCNSDSNMGKISYFHYALPLRKELQQGIVNVPTNSAFIMLAFSNLLVKLCDNIELDEYKLNHLGGSIGNDLKKIKDIMIKDYPSLLMSDNLKLIDIVLEMTNKKMGIVVIKNNEDSIIGIITDGDIRRLLLKNTNLTYIKDEHVNKFYYKFDDENIIFKDIKSLLLKYKFVPVMKDNKCLGILSENIIKNTY